MCIILNFVVDIKGNDKKVKCPCIHIYKNNNSKLLNFPIFAIFLIEIFWVVFVDFVKSRINIFLHYYTQKNVKQSQSNICKESLIHTSKDFKSRTKEDSGNDLQSISFTTVFIAFRKWIKCVKFKGTHKHIQTLYSKSISPVQ